MQRLILTTLLLASATVAAPALASDKLVFAPAPNWISPITAPADLATPDEAAIRILLLDRQVDLKPEGRTVYSDLIFRIQTPQGLAAGNISIPWSPETDVLTVHKLIIRRGREIIDVLKSGQTFTVIRRESNLENAVFDGILTASIQPEGLRVGDIIELSTSVLSNDPTLRGHVEFGFGLADAVPVVRSHVKAQWPTSVPVRVRQDGLPSPLKTTARGTATILEGTYDNVQPYTGPKGAPARFQIGPIVELTDFASWRDMATLLAPLYQKAAILPAQGPLRDEVNRIVATSPDPKKRAEAALALVQDRVRYVALLLGVGGLVPASAETTWLRRYGDCKAKTALLIAILKEAGIDAVSVVVNATGGDGLDRRLPLLGLFNHILVKATIAGKVYWLDGTRTGDTALERLKVPGFGWGVALEGAPGGNNGAAALVSITPPPSTTPEVETIIRIDATAGLSIAAPTTIEIIYRGDGATAVNLSIANIVGDARDRALRAFWKGQYDFIEPKTTTANFNAQAGELRLRMTGEAKMDWSDGYFEMDGAGVGYKADFNRDPGPSRDAPFAVAYPYFYRTTETILLPPGFANAKLGKDLNVDRTLAGIEYRRTVALTPSMITMNRTERSIVPEIPFAEAVAAQQALRDLAETGVYVPRPASYRLTDKELAASVNEVPQTYAGLIDRGLAFLSRGEFDKANADFTKASALDPRSAWPIANRAISNLGKGDTEAALKDLEAAEAIDPRNPVALRARGRIAEGKKDTAGAIAFYVKSLEVEPADVFANRRLIALYRQTDDDDRALSTIGALLKINPLDADLYLLRANIFRSMGKNDAVIGEAVAVAAADPNNSYFQIVAARIYDAAGQRDEALKAVDRALAIKPEAYIYLNRADLRAPDDLAGQKADLASGMQLDPTDDRLIVRSARLEGKMGNLLGGIAMLNRALASSKAGQSLLLMERGILYAKSGNGALADRDFAAVRAKTTTSMELNNICWTKAIAGVPLESALVDCNLALTKTPDSAAALDSRGFVFLRLGRIDDAIRDYDAALAKQPTQTASLFGRGIAWLRKGDKAKGEADLAAARNISPNIDRTFADYGVKP